MNNQTEDSNLKIPLTFTAEEANSTLKIERHGSAPVINLEYNLNDSGWKPYTQGHTITLANAGDKVQMRAAEAGNDAFSSSSSDFNRFVMTGKIAASGNVQSVLDRTLARTDVPAHCYSCMFFYCTSLTTAPALPATELADYCYSFMFGFCTSLANAPVLPATTLASNCYNCMFSGCETLTQAPELPATALAGWCYSYMFYGCKSLTHAPALPATILSDWCYYGMFFGCTSLINAPELPATALAYYCYIYMFNSTKVTSVDMKKSVEGVYSKEIHGILNPEIEISYRSDIL